MQCQNLLPDKLRTPDISVTIHLMRPSIPLANVVQVRPAHARALKKLGIETARDLLYHFPSRYETPSAPQTISGLVAGATATVYGKISGLKTSKAFHKRIAMAEGMLTDDTGSIKIVWFHQPYIAKMLREGGLVRAEGKVAVRKETLYLSNPKVEHVEKIPNAGENLFGAGAAAHALYGVYPETRGVTSNWLYHALQKVLQTGILDELDDPLPPKLLERYHLPSLKTALIWIHFPRTERDAQAARKRFAFEEIFFIQLERQRERARHASEPTFSITSDKKTLQKFMDRFPFSPTEAQKKTIETIHADLSKNHPMGRLLEGDVGSGKTFVAAATAYTVVTSGKNFAEPSASNPRFESASVPRVLQVAYMAPTEVLARQQFDSFVQNFAHLGINVGFITGSGCLKFPSKVNPHQATDISRAQLLKWVANGEIPILVGTHALIQKSVRFKHLAYVIIDEQHRFGVNQRQALVRGQTQAERGQTPTEAPRKDNVALLYKDLTYRIREAVFAVRKTLGLGHKEVVYQKALAEEFTQRKISFNRETQIPVHYRGKVVGTYQPDFVVDDTVIVELKALPFTGTTEKKQVWNYLKGSSYNLALLINFGQRDCSIERIVYEKARLSASGPQLSASSPRGVPHLLSMTATPIPRTLALTIYGDLDLSLLDEMPPGRKPIITEIVSPDNRTRVYDEIRKRLHEGRQAYVICPRIDEPDPTKEFALQAKSVTEEAARLKREVFPEFEIGIMHSKLKNDEKEKVMEEFKDGKINILVSTSVVEVGVNVVNATMIIIEGAERFGLAQLHQLRGRVVRSNEQAYCYVFTDSKSKTSLQRLKALQTAKNGFELAEKDLALRGSGELYGRQQWGISDIGMEALKNIKMVEAARAEAQAIIGKDPELEKHQKLKAVLADKQAIHFE